MKPTTSSQRSSVINLLKEGFSVHQIESKTGLGKSTIGRIKKEVDSDKENSKGGHPSKLTSKDKHVLLRQITIGKLDNAVQATHFINHAIPSPVCPQTVRNALKENNFCCIVKSKRPLLKAIHCQKHLKFAQIHVNWTVEDWKRILWSDETKINRIGSDGRVYTWKPRGEAISDRTTLPTVKHGGGNNLMVWGCMGWNGVGTLTEVEGKMNADQYCEILEHGVDESFENLEMPEGERIFQQDNDPKHTSKKAQQWFLDNGIEVLEWPPQSPDINPIEHLWTHLKRQMNTYETPPKGAFELWERLAKEWTEIPPETCQRLIESMPRRMEAVIKAKGGHTKY